MSEETYPPEEENNQQPIGALPATKEQLDGQKLWGYIRRNWLMFSAMFGLIGLFVVFALIMTWHTLHNAEAAMPDNSATQVRVTPSTSSAPAPGTIAPNSYAVDANGNPIQTGTGQPCPVGQQCGQQTQQRQQSPAEELAEEYRKKRAELDWAARTSAPDARSAAAKSGSTTQNGPSNEGTKPEVTPSNAFNTKEEPVANETVGNTNAQPKQVTAACEHTGRTWMIPAGLVPIKARLLNAINGDMAGQWIAEISQPAYSWDDTRLLIPKGSFLSGRYDRVSEGNQERLLLQTGSLMMPDGCRMEFPIADSMDQQGMTGLHDKVNHHYLQLILTAVGTSALSAGATFGSSGSGSYGFSPADALKIGFAEGASQAGQQIFSRFANRRPTIILRAGQMLIIFPPVDFILPEWGNHHVAPI
jgi:type IV secretion system protein TrbI